MLKRTRMSRAVTGLLAGIALAVASAAAANGAATPALSLEELLSAPLQYGLTASANTPRIAWIANYAGSRNIWIARRSGSGTLTAKALTQFTGDDGIELDDLKWSHDASQLVFSHGGSLEGGGPVNPRSLPAGPVTKVTGWRHACAIRSSRR